MRRRAFLLCGTAAMAAVRVPRVRARSPLLDSPVRRPFGWGDAENRTGIEHVTISCAVDAIALQVTRPLSAGGMFGGEAWSGQFDSRGDVWVLDRDLRRAKRLDVLPGGAWAPCFSPDGTRLSALTMVAPGQVGLVVWELSRGTYRIFSTPNVEIFLSKFRTHRSAYAAPSASSQAWRQYLWLDAQSILYVDHGSAPQQFLLSSGSLSPTLQAYRARTEAGRASVRIWSDHSPTCGTGSRLARVTLETGEIQTLYEGDVRGVSLSPDRLRVAALVATENYPPTPGKPIDQPLRTMGMDQPMVESKLTLIDLAEPGGARDIDGIINVGNVAPSRLPRWSDDGSRLAIPVRTSYSDIRSTGDDAVWEVLSKTGETRKRIALSALDAELLTALIATDGLNVELVIEKRPRDTSEGEIQGGAWRCAQQQVMFWNAPALTLITPAQIMRLPGEFASVYSPAVENYVARTIAIGANGKTSLITSSAGRYRMQKLATQAGWVPLGVRARDAAVIYGDDADTGSWLVLAKPEERPRRSQLVFNTYFRDVLRPQRRMLTHTFPDGTVRSGLLQLPSGHRAGERHPVIVYAYPNSIPAISDPLTRVNTWAAVHYPIQFLLTKGFAFFHVPFPIGGKRSLQPMVGVAHAVAPWLDVLDRQVDIIPGDYGFWGHSNAGYAALALEALGRRFKAIVAWDTFPEIGFDNLHTFSWDVALDCGGNLLQSERGFYEDPRQPYAPEPAPPWKNPAEYIRNDPLFNLNRASTPILLVEGELDVSPREMEEVYSILYGRGVPVELAYYWGEGHNFASPGNIHDSWLRTERFFRRYIPAR